MLPIGHNAERVSQYSGNGAVAVTPHEAATRSALRVMEMGGTAADAVVAANAMLGVVLPTTCGIGGDLFALVHVAGRPQPDVLNASGRGGSGLDAALLRSRGLTRFEPHGPDTISVPGCVDGWVALLERHGRLGLDEVLSDAIAAAREGFPVSTELADSLHSLRAALSGQPSAVALYPDGTPPDRGDTIRRPDLAATMEAVASGGRSAFYQGPVADAIVTASQGILSAEDLAANRPDWVDPIGIDVFGSTAWTVPPNSQGYLTLAALWGLERLAPPDDPDDPKYHHLAIEAYRAFAWERNDVVADPSHTPWAIDAYLDPQRLEERISSVDPDSAAEWPEPSPGPPGTAFFCAVDSEGMAVSCIQSNYFGIGSRVSAGDTGVFLHNRGAGFSLIEDHPNEAAPGKRPLHTLSPTLWTRGGEAALVLGTRGGDQQPQYLLQMASLLLHAGLEPAEAQARPRWSIRTDSPVAIEAAMPEGVVSGLRDAGHRVTLETGPTPGWGPVSVISLDRDGVRKAAADPRVSTASAAGS